MKIFRCDSCGHPVFFENVQCLHCGSQLAFLPDLLALCAIEQEAGSSPPLWHRKTRSPEGKRGQYRLCDNHVYRHACNFAVLAEDPNPLCVSCRQTRILPDLSAPANHDRWYHIEIAKRRLFYTLARLGLASAHTFDGPTFEFLADSPGQPPVMTGHINGVITLNVAEADDDERARRRLLLHEPYRTLLGHLRHESGHYYWDRLVRDGNRVAQFRQVFGDESQDYVQALAAHYAGGGRADWQREHVSAYATAHPWEDWAETWAHYLHMVDLLETASSYHTRVIVPGSDLPEPGNEVNNPFETGMEDFDRLVQEWVPVTLLLNSLNRSLGQNDAYPFALTEGALRKLRYVHDLIHASVVAPAVVDQDKPALSEARLVNQTMDDQPAAATAQAAA